MAKQEEQRARRQRSLSKARGSYARSKRITNPLQIQLHADVDVIREARRLILEEQVRMPALAACIGQDPVMLIEFIKAANQVEYAAKEGETTALLTALLRLGTEVASQHLQQLAGRPVLAASEVSRWFEFYRAKGRRRAIVARILGELTTWRTRELCQAAGGMTCIGDLLAVAFFQEEYVELAREKSYPGINYHLQQHRHFDVEQVGLRYLRRHGIPEVLAIVLARDAEAPSTEMARTRTAAFAAAEMVDAFDYDRWDRIAPDRILNPKSYLRLLYMPSVDYARAYQRVGRYLFELQLAAEKRVQAERERAIERGEAPPPLIAVRPVLENADAPAAETASCSDSDAESLMPQAPSQEQASQCAAMEEPGPVELSPADSAVPPAANRLDAEAQARAITSLFEEARTCKELLYQLLKDLVRSGLFARSALLLVSQSCGCARVVAAHGHGLENERLLPLDDALTLCFSTGKLLGDVPAGQDLGVCPFGSSAFVVLPIHAPSGQTISLYVDGGLDGTITTEAQLVFQRVVDRVNQKLPMLPGSRLA